MLILSNNSAPITIVARCSPHEQAGVRKLILNAVRESIQQVVHSQASEYRVTVIATTRSPALLTEVLPKTIPSPEGGAPSNLLSSSLQIEAVAEPLPPPPTPPISVQIETGTRSDPTIKGTAWVRERRPWEQMMRTDCEEVLLADLSGRLHEGLSSNLVVLLADGITLQGAPRGSILQGSILQVIMEKVAPFLGLCVREAFPLTSELSSYRALFICSTSRLLLPVDRVYYGGTIIDYHSSKDPILVRMQEQLQQALLMRATKLI